MINLGVNLHVNLQQDEEVKYGWSWPDWPGWSGNNRGVVGCRSGKVWRDGWCRNEDYTRIKNRIGWEGENMPPSYLVINQNHNSVHLLRFIRSWDDRKKPAFQENTSRYFKPSGYFVGAGVKLTGLSWRFDAAQERRRITDNSLLYGRSDW